MIRLLLGLGNIGSEYHNTRHNVGMEVLERVVVSLKARRQPATDLYEWWTVRRHTNQITLAWPRAYMNRSGNAAEALLEITETTPDKMLVISDDFNLPLGRLRFRKAGSDGGHNGLASIIQTIGTESFPRLRMGIGHIPDGSGATEFVLGEFHPDELKIKQKMLETSAEAVLFSLKFGLTEAMNKYNNVTLPG